MADPVFAHARVHAWAKINLDLRILAREVSGYHQIETVFQRISLSDDVDVRLTAGEGISLHCSPPVDVAMEDNLAVRAAILYRDAAQWPAADVRIELALHKRIPTGAGLGGGSADAGAVLRALNALNPQPLPADVLLPLAAVLGADVPFLTTDVPHALAWGRGDRLLALPPLPTRDVHCALFTNGVNTAQAYAALAAARDAGAVAPTVSGVLHVDALTRWDAVRARSRNDFETPVFAVRPDIAAVAHDWRTRVPDAVVHLSGSGATVYAITGTLAPELVVSATQWPGADGVRYQHASTLAVVPPVTILSPVP
jgi:4-diphosphocytidyl-2-C-methyl-D-erythritol kinase